MLKTIYTFGYMLLYEIYKLKTDFLFSVELPMSCSGLTYWVTYFFSNWTHISVLVLQLWWRNYFKIWVLSFCANLHTNMHMHAHIHTLKELSTVFVYSCLLFCLFLFYTLYSISWQINWKLNGITSIWLD